MLKLLYIILFVCSSLLIKTSIALISSMNYFNIVLLQFPIVVRRSVCKVKKLYQTKINDYRGKKFVMSINSSSLI